MPFTRMQEAIEISAKVDTAMNRRDDMGMELLRDLLPEVRDIIDAINTGLREVDELLFQGLRDEAITLNDPEFSRVAARLNLVDKEAWPEVQAFFEREGIAPPPKIDFETLEALESAHAELAELGRHLERVRRLVLERAPVAKRLGVLRRLRDADGTKPVWAATIAEHERARVAELPDAVKKAFAEKDPAAIADLHAEIVDPDWSIAVPRDLVRATRGADIWNRLREAVPAAEAAAEALASGMPDAGVEADPSAVPILRQARQAWYEASGTVRECQAALTACPNVATLVRAEGLEARFEGLGPRVDPVLAWLDQIDGHESALARNAQSVAQLEALLGYPPRKARDEQQWLASVAHLERELVSQGLMDAGLQDRVTAALASVRGRAGTRLFLKVAAGVAAAAAMLTVAIWVQGCVAEEADRAATVRTLKAVKVHAVAGAYDTLPEAVSDAKAGHPDDEEIGRLVDSINTAIHEESQRRKTLKNWLEEQANLLEEAKQDCEDRDRPEQGLQPWPESIESAAAAWREARKVGGDPSSPEVKRDRPENPPASLTKRWQEEDEKIAKAKTAQERMETKFYNSATQAFRDRLNDINKRVQVVTAEDRDEVLGMIAKLRDEAKADKVTEKTFVLRDPKNGRGMIAESEITRLDDLERRLLSQPVEPTAPPAPAISTEPGEAALPSEPPSRAEPAVPVEPVEGGQQ